MGSTESIPIDVGVHQSRVRDHFNYGDKEISLNSCLLSSSDSSSSAMKNGAPKHVNSGSNILGMSNSKEKLVQTNSGKKKVRLIRKPAQRTVSIGSILKGADEIKITKEISSPNDRNDNNASNEKKLNQSEPILKRKIEQLSILMKDTTDNEHSPSEKRALKPSVKKLAADESSLIDESDSSDKQESCTKKKKKVLNHVLFSSEASDCSSTKSSSKGKECMKGKPQEENYDNQPKFPESTADTIGPPRTEDQNSDRVISPHIHDVLMGRGNGVAQFPGNQIFRGFCWNAREAYHKAMRNAKGKVAEEVITLVEKRNPPGRFLERQSEGYFTVVPFHRVKEKICQALREKKWTPSDKAHDDPDTDEQSCSEETISVSSNPRKTGCVVESSSQKEENISEKKLEHSDKSSQNVSIDISSDVKPKNAKQKEISKSVMVSSERKEKQVVVKRECREGSRVSVYWPLNDSYYDATVIHCKQDKFYLEYDDQETEWIELYKHKYKIISANKTTASKTSLAAVWSVRSY